MLDYQVPEAPCSSPFLSGLSLNDVCTGNSATLFLSMVNMLATYSPIINGVCERITPIKRPQLIYDFIVVGGKIINVSTCKHNGLLRSILSNNLVKLCSANVRSITRAQESFLIVSIKIKIIFICKLFVGLRGYSLYDSCILCF